MSEGAAVPGFGSPPAIVGMIESIGQMGASELFVSGWARSRPAPGAPVLAMLDDCSIQAQFISAWSDRDDVGPNTGFSGIVECASPLLAADLRGLRLSGARIVTLYEGRTLIDEYQSIGLLRSSLRSASNEATQALRQAAARFDGTDTVSSSPLPVRVGIDDCVALPGDGLLLSGWLLDPEGLVESVWLGGAFEPRRLDDIWVTRARPDVASNFAAQPRYALHDTGGQKAGFTVLRQGVASAEVHLTLQLRGGEALHLPLGPRQGAALPLLRGFLRSIDPDLASSLDIVDRQIAPALAALPPVPPSVLWQSQAALHRTADVSIIIGCSADAANIPALLAILAADPAARQVPILVVASATELASARGEIERAADFYGQALNLVCGDAMADHFDALVVGASVAQAPVVALLAADLAPVTPHWFGRLLVARQVSGADVVVTGLFDGAQTGEPQARSRLSSSPEAGIMPRDAFLRAAAGDSPCLHRGSKSGAALAQLDAMGLRRSEADDIVTCRMAPADASSVLARRADRQAQRLRAGTGGVA